MTRRAYSLIEFALALAIAGIVTTAALSLYASLVRSFSDMRKRTYADDNAKTVVAYLGRELRRAGGYTLRPWQAIAVDDQTSTTCNSDGLPPCQGSDRLTLAFPVEQRATGCALSNPQGDSSSASYQSGTIDGVCCFTWFRGGVGPNITSQQVILTHGPFSRAAVITAVDTSQCRATLVPSAQGAPLTLGTAALHQFGGGALVHVDLATYYRGCADDECVPDERSTHSLLMWLDRNATSAAATINDDEVFLVAPLLFDLQIALGYDARNRDGVIHESETEDEDDELLFNHRGVDTLAALKDEIDVDLRVAKIVAVSGVRQSNPREQSIQVLNAEVLVGRGIHFSRFEATAALRNLGIFQ